MYLGLGYAGDVRGPNLKVQLLLLASLGYLSATVQHAGTGCSAISAASLATAQTRLESNPPESTIPTGTSDISLSLTLNVNVSNRPAGPFQSIVGSTFCISKREELVILGKCHQLIPILRLYQVELGIHLQIM
jgi:hypothetical protein